MDRLIGIILLCRELEYEAKELEALEKNDGRFHDLQLPDEQFLSDEDYANCELWKLHELDALGDSDITQACIDEFRRALQTFPGETNNRLRMLKVFSPWVQFHLDLTLHILGRTYFASRGNIRVESFEPVSMATYFRRLSEWVLKDVDHDKENRRLYRQYELRIQQPKISWKEIYRIIRDEFPGFSLPLSCRDIENYMRRMTNLFAKEHGLPLTSDVRRQLKPPKKRRRARKTVQK